MGPAVDYQGGGGSFNGGLNPVSSFSHQGHGHVTITLN